MASCRNLHIDIETYSSTDLKTAGVYRYVEGPSFQIMLLAYAVDDAPVRVIDLMGDETAAIDMELERVFELINDQNIIKFAYNAAFEIICLREYCRREGHRVKFDYSQWRCTLVLAQELGLPAALDDVSKVMGLPSEKAKLSSGKKLIQYFCKPCSPTKVNGFRTRNLPVHAPAKWSEFIEYNRRDVEAERDINNRLAKHPLNGNEQKLWEMDQRINCRGIKVDRKLINNAIELDKIIKEQLFNQAVALTGITNPNSVAQIKTWISETENCEIGSLNKESIPEILKNAQNSDTVELLNLRKQLAKTSIKKYKAMLNGICRDDRIRGLLQFYGANRTGRWAGRLVQVHNLPKNKMKHLDVARHLLRDGDYTTLEMLFPSVPDVLSQLIRTAFIPDIPNDHLLVADFSAIEARVIAWLAGEKWRLDVFNSHGKIYEASAAQMFSVPIDKVDKALRQKGKVSELALGFQGGKGALIKMGALDMGLKEQELSGLVETWRQANPKIVELWQKVETSAFTAIREKRTVKLRLPFTTLIFERVPGYLFIVLPSGRKLAYVRPLIEPHPRFEMRDCIRYEGQNQTTKKWEKIETYGGKLTENIVQAIARDCLAYALQQLENEARDTLMHVHDEAIISGDPEDLDAICEIMARNPVWAANLPLSAAGFFTKHYRKED